MRGNVWDRLVEGYLATVDRSFDQGERLLVRFEREEAEAASREAHARLLLRVTLAGLGLTMFLFLMSCATLTGQLPPSNRPLPAGAVNGGFRSRVVAGGHAHPPEQLYVKRDTPRIEERETGSKTGSLWADARQPQGLFSEPRPTRVGDVVTVLIPDDLQFKWDGDDNKKGGKTGRGDERKNDRKTGAEKDRDKIRDREHDKLDDDLFQHDPYDMGGDHGVGHARLASLKMEVIALEAGGDLYLRANRSFESSTQGTRDMMILAKVPARDAQSFDIDARALVGVELSEDVGGQRKTYASTGWDPVVSRKVAGYAPDVSAELSALDDVRSELAVNQEALRDQQKALRGERERLRKERDRMALQSASQSAALASAGTQNGNAAAGPKGTAPNNAPQGGAQTNAGGPAGSPSATTRTGAGGNAGGNGNAK